ncbi:MAG: bifunctional diaminohydroxyphosphoribosylaminopyrimidine deaminase/5-amino-6-(5-phosphoribosylamino)uracil reductase RibD [Clostridia bacterium]|nr:bifunctional diaminohydroxyphosphoribosylaminopyrimidine deaminase/5-amino-6-(5-phosphoribosylamino)uracil reductase RibD [Clostridia bacterium]
MKDEEYMKMALELSDRGQGCTSPNPLVGAVIVNNGRIIGRGWHRKYGGLHAEREAIKNAKETAPELLKGAVMYVTLEPCCHYGKQPPCTEAIIEEGISKVVVGSQDPNPAVAGKGIKILREHGIEVIGGVLKEQCDRQNEIFMHFIRTGTPYVALKYAMSADGKIATHTGESKWITNEKSREYVHRLRGRYSAIMAGIGTVLRDDPLLTCRIEGGRNPLRIICDSRLRIPTDSNIVRTAKEVPTIIATCTDDPEKASRLRDCGCRVLAIGKTSQKAACIAGANPAAYTEAETAAAGEVPDLRELFKVLADEGTDSILVEGGAALNWSALQSGMVKKVYTFIAPKIFGGKGAPSPIAGDGVNFPSEAVELCKSSITEFDGDFLIESEVKSRVYGNS